MPGTARAKRTSKHRNIRTEYKGELYDSRKEAQHAAYLDLRLRAGEFRCWERGKQIALVAGGVELKGPSGRRLYYKPDFEITKHDGTKELIDVKGRRDTKDVAYRLFWLKRELMRAMGLLVREV